MYLFIISIVAFTLSCSFLQTSKALFQVGDCNPNKGLLVYFDVTNCDQDVQTKYTPIAIQYIDGEPHGYGSVSPQLKDTICLPDDFNGNLYYSNDQKGFPISNIHLQTISSNQTFQAFYQTRPDDQAFAPGNKTLLTVLNEVLLDNIRFANTIESAPMINYTATPNQVLQSNQIIGNALYVTYCPKT